MVWGSHHNWSGWCWESSTWTQASSDDATSWPSNNPSDKYTPTQKTTWKHTPTHQTTWNPYCVHCKSHGWQQCPACSAEIGISQRVPSKAAPPPGGDSCQRMCNNSAPRKRPRHSVEDDVDLDQIFSFVAALNAEQLSPAASVLFEHYQDHIKYDVSASRGY